MKNHHPNSVVQCILTFLFISSCREVAIGAAAFQPVPPVTDLSGSRRQQRWTLMQQQSKSLTKSEPIAEVEVSDKVYHTSSFWGVSRSEEEIVEFVAMNCFDSSENISCMRDKVEVVSVDPPLLYIHNFIDVDLCDAITNTAKGKGLDRSTVGSDKETQEMRTSRQTWLKEDDETLKYNHDSIAAMRKIASKISRITCLPTSHQENLQVVRYERGQKFDIHLDHLDEFNDLECRGRLATCLIYLNDGDGIEFDGGETYFPEFEFKAVPKKGSAVFFWNTIERPGEENYSSHMFLSANIKLRHSGLEILDGTKWICNRWVHPVPLHAGVIGENM